MPIKKHMGQKEDSQAQKIKDAALGQLKATMLAVTRPVKPTAEHTSGDSSGS